MLNKFKFELLSTLLDFNFFFSEIKSKKKNYSYKNIIIIKHSKAVAILDPTILIKNVKQTVRLLQHAQAQEFSTLLIDSKNKYFSELFFFLSKKKNIFEQKIDTKLDFYSNKKKKNTVVFSINQKNSCNYYKKLFSNNIFLVNEINSNNQESAFGNYKLNNNVEDWKRLVFLILLIKKIYTKNL